MRIRRLDSARALMRPVAWLRAMVSKFPKTDQQGFFRRNPFSPAALPLDSGRDLARLRAGRAAKRLYCGRNLSTP